MPIEQVQTLIRIDDARGNSQGYQVMHNGVLHMIYNGSTALVPITQPKESSTREVLAKKASDGKMIDYDNLLTAHYTDGECPYCEEYPNQIWSLCLTSHGYMRLITCRNCNRKFRPDRRQELYPSDERKSNDG